VYLQVLGSSSGGNCTVVGTKDSAFLVDCGFGPRYVERHLRALGLTIEQLAGVFITHTHADHVNGRMLQALMQAGIPLFVPGKVLKPLFEVRPLLREMNKRSMVHPMDGVPARIGRQTATDSSSDVEVSAFPVPHDSPGGCYGYSFVERNGSGMLKATVATDIGFATPAVIEAFENSDIMVIESNHDPDMLLRSGRPAALRQRISRGAHLSNHRCAELICSVLERSERHPHSIVLAHLSRECNTHALALKATTQVLRSFGHSSIRVLTAFHNRSSEIVLV
jgi:phosphoribosyl 1,2-cyclic phosphodiesterase